MPVTDINEFISRAAPNGEVNLPSGEFEGPLVINKPVRLRGNNTTLWAKNSPVVRITAGGVTIENIRAEITEGSIEEPAIISTAPCAAKNVEVLGRVSGFGEEDGCFDIPRTISLGGFPADRENSYKLEVNVPARTEVYCDMREVRLSPSVLNVGRNELTVTVNGISPQTYLYAELLFKSRFTRRVYLTGKPDNSSPQAVSKPIYSAPVRERSPDSPKTSAKLSEAAVETVAQAIHEMMSQSPISDIIPMTGRQNKDLPRLVMRRGQRVGLTQYLGDRFEVLFSANTPRGFEIDPYVFLLEEGDRAAEDESLIFFGNPRSRNGEAEYFPADGHIAVDLTKISPTIQRIAVCYSIYEGNADKSFGKVGAPTVSMRISGEEKIGFTIDGLSSESTIVAVEFYLYKGEWKISAVGAGFKDGLAKLCNKYGISVE